jgi:hypothetical protein
VEREAVQGPATPPQQPELLTVANRPSAHLSCPDRTMFGRVAENRLVGQVAAFEMGHVAGKAVKGKNRRVCPLAPASEAGIAAVYPEAVSAWLCVQHEEDGPNACTCADESI